MARKQKTPEQIFRDAAFPKERKPRRKSAVTSWYEKMLAEHKANGAEHLASARAKMGQK